MTRTFHLLLVLAMAAGVAGCRGRTESSDAPSGREAPPAHRVAVLQVEDSVEWALVTPGSGGPAVHIEQVTALAQDLGTTVVVIPPGAEDASLAGYSSAVLVDAAAVPEALVAELEALATRGGIVVAIGQLGGMTDEATRRLGALFGYVPGTSPPMTPPPPVDALTVSPGPLLEGLVAGWSFGPAALVAQAMQATTASSAVTDAGGRILLARSGNAVWMPVLPSGRRFGGWRDATAAKIIVRNALGMAAASALSSEEPSPRLVIGVNAYGYRPDDPKRIIVRVPGAAEPVDGTWSVRAADGADIAAGALLASASTAWGSRYAIADVSAVTATGEFTVRLVASGVETSVALRVRAADEWLAGLLAMQQSFLEGMRCGEVCHLDSRTPVGGYHHSVLDRSARMESMPFVVWALAAIVDARPDLDRFRYELERSVMWCWKMTGPDGWPRAASDSQEPAGFDAAAAYAAALARAVKPVRQHISQNLAPEVQFAAERVLLQLAARDAQSTSDIAARMWAAVEVADRLGIEDYRAAAVADARRLFARQLQPGQVTDGDLYGDFLETADGTTFSPRQYRRGAHPGLLFAIDALASTHPDGSVRADLGTVALRLREGWLRGYASLTPYGVPVAGLEPAQPLKPRPAGRGGFEAPEQFSARLLQPPLPDLARRGANDGLLLAAAYGARQEATRAIALESVNWIFGANPLGLCMVHGVDSAKEAPGPAPAPDHLPVGAIYNGIVGRGASLTPAWGAGPESRDAGLLANAWMLTLLAELAR